MSEKDEFTLEKFKIHDRLLLVETEVKSMSEKMDLVYKNIVGNGDEGLRTKVTVLQNFRADMKVAINRLWTFVIGILIAFTVKLLADFKNR